MKSEEFTGEVSFFVLKVHMDCSTLTDGAGSFLSPPTARDKIWTGS